MRRALLRRSERCCGSTVGLSVASDHSENPDVAREKEFMNGDEARCDTSWKWESSALA